MTTINENIKDAIALRAVEQAHPAYAYENGEWYVVNGEELVFANRNTKWPENANAISIDDLIWQTGGGEEQRISLICDNYDDEEEIYAAISLARTLVPEEY